MLMLPLGMKLAAVKRRRRWNDGRKDNDGDGRIHLAFDRDIRTIAISEIVPLKSLPDGARESRKFAQVLSSIKAIGLIEAPVRSSAW